jgi:hypothetical protein
MAERSSRGELQKARSGKVVGGHPVNYGFRITTPWTAGSQGSVGVLRRCSGESGVGAGWLDITNR